MPGVQGVRGMGQNMEREIGRAQPMQGSVWLLSQHFSVSALLTFGAG